MLKPSNPLCFENLKYAHYQRNTYAFSFPMNRTWDGSAAGPRADPYIDE